MQDSSSRGPGLGTPGLNTSAYTLLDNRKGFSPLNGAIKLFHQAICLWVVWCTEASGNAKLLTQVRVDLENALDMKVRDTFLLHHVVFPVLRSTKIQLYHVSSTYFVDKFLPTVSQDSFWCTILIKKVHYTLRHLLSPLTF